MPYNNIKTGIKYKMLEGLDIMDYYYASNIFWINFNIFFILPFIVACIVRFFNQDVNKNLLTDYPPRILLFMSCIFYVYDMVVKYKVDGAETIC